MGIHTMNYDSMNYLYQSSGIPAMQNLLYPTAHDATRAPVASLALVQEEETGLVFNAAFNPDLVRYDQDYQNDQSLSPQFQRHLDAIASLVENWCSKGPDLIVEVGCGKGAFVEILRGKDYSAIGYDNAYQGDSPYIRKQFFGSESHEKGDFLILRHVLEHIPNPWDFLDRLADANSGKGYLYIEVPDLDWILDNNAYFDLFHEHVNYFRLKDFKRIYGDDLVHAERSFGGQYLSLVLSLGFSGKPRKAAGSAQIPSGSSSSSQLFDRLKLREQSVYQELESYEEIVIWGAAAKGVTFCCKAPSSCLDKIKFAVDINPGKQGMFMPISGVPVLSPEEGIPLVSRSTLVVIMNPNYTSEILQSLPQGQPHLSLH